MKYLAMLLAALFACLWVGCSSTGQDVTETPVGSVLTGDTKDPDAYLEKVEKQNAQKTKAASQNQTDYQSHEHTNFGTMGDRY